MRLPDGGFKGSGFASNGYQSLQEVWTGSTATIEAVDRSSSYTLSTLTSTLEYFIASFQPEQVNTLDYRRTYGDGDHSDHHTVSYLTRSAMAHCNSLVAFIGYEGYPVIHLPVNVPDVDQKAKQSAFLTYVQHDKQVRDLLSESASTLYDSWLARQYRVPAPLIDRPLPRTNMAREASGFVASLGGLCENSASASPSALVRNVSKYVSEHGDTSQQVICNCLPD